jgi:hypothetical protein
MLKREQAISGDIHGHERSTTVKRPGYKDGIRHCEALEGKNTDHWVPVCASDCRILLEVFFP